MRVEILEHLGWRSVVGDLVHGLAIPPNVDMTSRWHHEARREERELLLVRRRGRSGGTDARLADRDEVVDPEPDRHAPDDRPLDAVGAIVVRDRGVAAGQPGQEHEPARRATT